VRTIFKIFGLVVALYLAAAVAVAAFAQVAKGGQRDRIRAFNRDTLNPWMLERAGGEHWYASVLRHTGRTSGRAYETPVVMHPIAGGFAIPLPYGNRVDWLENLRRSGGTALHKGVEYALSDPIEVGRDSISDQLGWRDSLRYRLFGIDDFITLRDVSQASLAG
jgi:hypothetical protein